MKDTGRIRRRQKQKVILKEREIRGWSFILPLGLCPLLFFLNSLKEISCVSVYFTLQLSPHFSLLSVVYYACMEESSTQEYIYSSLLKTESMSGCFPIISSSTTTHSSTTNPVILNILNLRSQHCLVEIFGLVYWQWLCLVHLM